MSFPGNYCNTPTFVAHIRGEKQVWIGDDGEASVVVVHGCPSSSQPDQKDMGKQLAPGPE